MFFSFFTTGALFLSILIYFYLHIHLKKENVPK